MYEFFAVWRKKVDKLTYDQCRSTRVRNPAQNDVWTDHASAESEGQAHPSCGDDLNLKLEKECVDGIWSIYWLIT